MKIAYVNFWDVFVEDGVVKKLRLQSGHWRAAGHHVELFCLTPKPPEPASPVLEGEIFTFDGGRQRFTATRALASAVRDFAADVLYLRYDVFLPPILRALAERPMVVELNSRPDEFALRPLLPRTYERWNRRRILSCADGVVCDSHELADDPTVERLGKPVVVIGNGIDVAAFPVTPPPASERPRGVFLGTPGQPWQGIDKLRLLATLLPEFDFDVVGPAPAELGGPAPPNLRMHGFLTRERYEAIVTTADFGIGSLAQYRKRQNELAPLKVREYLAYGLPVLIAHKDPDLTNEPHWFVLELPNHDRNVADGAEAVRAWVSSIKGSRVGREEADRLVGAEPKEAERLRLMRRVAAGEARVEERAVAPG